MTNDPMGGNNPGWQQPGPSEPIWPTMPGRGPATQPAGDPLGVAERRTLAPEAMPTRHDPAADPAPTSATPAAAALPPDQGAQVPCPRCGAPVHTYEAFCEDCGSTLTPTTARPARHEPGTELPFVDTSQDLTHDPAADTAAHSGPTTQPLVTDEDLDEPPTRACPECGSVIGPDGYCTGCGAKSVSRRDHFTESPATWVGGCSDRGIRHSRNEDALSLAADPTPGSRAVLVVCDGVSTSEASDVASLAGARTARRVLDAAVHAGDPEAPGRDGIVARGMVDAVAEANAAVVSSTDPASTNAASCTFVAAVVENGRIHVGNVGDSRAYWLPDRGSAVLLTVDDSIAQARIAMGVSREEAESGYQAHAITRWLGRDASDIVPRTAAGTPRASGWLMVCSDGLWNYRTEPDALRDLVAERQAELDVLTPVALAESLAAWACEQGGKDNISVALARLEHPEESEDPIDLDADTVPSKF